MSGGLGKTGKFSDGRPHDLVECNVGRARVESAGELLLRDREGRELPRHIETPAQGGEVVFVFGVLLRDAPAHRVGELAAVEPDQQLQERVALPAKLGDRPSIDADVARHGQHVDQPGAQGGVVHVAFARSFDFRQDLKLAIGRGDYPHHATGAQPFSAVLQHPFAAAP